jgi:hypothetical protein
MNDLTILYLTANQLPEKFAVKIRTQLVLASNGAGVISVTKEPLFFGNPNLHFDRPRSHVTIYRNALDGARAVKTKYIAFAEDDVLYSPEHFKKRPTRLLTTQLVGQYILGVSHQYFPTPAGETWGNLFVIGNSLLKQWKRGLLNILMNRKLTMLFGLNRENMKRT